MFEDIYSDERPSIFEFSLRWSVLGFFAGTLVWFFDWDGLVNPAGPETRITDTLFWSLGLQEIYDGRLFLSWLLLSLLGAGAGLGAGILVNLARRVAAAGRGPGTR